MRALKSALLALLLDLESLCQTLTFTIINLILFEQNTAEQLQHVAFYYFITVWETHTTEGISELQRPGSSFMQAIHLSYKCRHQDRDDLIHGGHPVPKHVWLPPPCPQRDWTASRGKCLQPAEFRSKNEQNFKRENRTSTVNLSSLLLLLLFLFLRPLLLDPFWMK